MKKVEDNLTDSRVEENEYNLNYFIFDTRKKPRKNRNLKARACTNSIAQTMGYV